MRKSLAVFGFLLGSLSLAQGQKTRFGKTPEKIDPAKFPVHLHISGSHQIRSCSGYGSTVNCFDDLVAEAIIDGKKVELYGDATIGKLRWSVLAPGDYLAQITQDNHNADSTAISRRYLLLLSDGTTWACSLSGISE